jgi:hypothetical protein
MENLVPYLIWAIVILVGLSLLMMLVFGLRSVSYGKVNPVSIVIIAIPMALFVGLGFSIGDWAQAGIYAVVIMLGLGLLGLLFSSVRGLIGL